MRIAYFDCFSGISGDMTIGAFLDAGLSFDKLSRELKKLKIKGYRLKAEKVIRNGLSGTKFDVITDSSAHSPSHKTLKDIKDLIDSSVLSRKAKDIALDIFQKIGEAERKVHGGGRTDSVTLHELGEVDSIIDIAGTAIALDEMGIDEVYSSNLNLGRTFVSTKHGTIPIPGPASIELLKGIPARISDIEAELVTPTGAGILKALAKGFDGMPLINIEAVGYGAGSKALKEIPNMLRIVIGEKAGAYAGDKVTVIETNIDDMSPQNFEYLFERLFKEGALDVYTSNIMMKKSRPAFKLTVLCEPQAADKMKAVIFAETTTIGLRFYEASRAKLEKKTVNVNTRYGEVKVKVSEGPHRAFTASPEYDDCVRLAREKKAPLKMIYEEAKRAVKISMVSILLFCVTASADTIYTKDGKEIKGIMVEDYRDRMLFSTPDGEVTVMKQDVKELYFDSEEDNLIKLAEQALEKKDYTKSFAYYDMAFKANPESKRAKDGVVFLQGFLFRKEQAIKEDVVRRQEEFEHRNEAPALAGKSEEDEVKARAERLRRSLGIALSINGGFPAITEVAPGSPAYLAGARSGDMLISVWGKLAGYLSIKEITDTLLDKPSLEIKMVIERRVDVPVSARGNPMSGPVDLIGAALGMQFDGLTVLDVTDQESGLKKDDLITAINGRPTRYMPFKEAVKIIRSSANNVVKLTIRREMIIWRKDQV